MINVNLDHRKIGFLVSADYFRIVLNRARVILQADANAVRLLDHMPVSHDKSLRVNQHARTEGTLANRTGIALAAKKFVEEVAERIIFIAAWILPAPPRLRLDG